MFSQEELNISNKSYINKDFPALYNELLDIAQKISYKYDPTTSNESDPMIVLCKLIALAGDKLNYNVDKNILERFLPSITQWNAMQERTSSLGYNMHYYQSAEGYINIKYNKNIIAEDLEEMTEGSYIIFPAYSTQFANSNNNVNYILTKPIELTKEKILKGLFEQGPIIQGELKTFTTLTGDESLVTMSDLDSENRLYFPEQMVAQNGVVIEQENVMDDWELVDNLNDQAPLTRCYVFRYDAVRKLPYLQFPNDIASLINGGLSIRYVITNGENGNVSADSIDTLNTNAEVYGFTPENENIKNIANLDNYLVTNPSALTNGTNIENIDEAYLNFQKTIGTFDTLVTCRDYANYIYNLKDEDFNSLVSNIQVCDRRDDFNYASKIITYNEFGQSSKTVVDNDEVSPFDLLLYPLQPMSGSDWKDYNNSFKPLSNTSTIERALEYSKCLSHTYKPLKPTDIYAIKNYYKLNAKIATTYKVNQLEQTAIRENIIQSLISNFNARKVNYGEEIPYDTILSTIENADSRIKFVSLDEPELETKLLLSSGVENSWVGVNDSRKLKYIAKNVLSGKCPLYNYNEQFSYDFGQTGSTIASNVQFVSTCAKLSVPTTEYELKDNEVVQVFTPSFVNGREWSYGWFYETIGFNNELELDGTEIIVGLDDNHYIEIYDSKDSPSPKVTLKNGYAKVKGIKSSTDIKQINSGASITEQMLNKVTLSEPYYLYWITNNSTMHNGEECSEIVWDNNEYVLLDGEYLYVTDYRYSFLTAYGPGTKLQRTVNTIMNDKLPLLDATEIEEKGLNYLKNYFRLFSFNDDNPGTQLNLIEQQILTLTSGDTIRANASFDLYDSVEDRFVNNLMNIPTGKVFTYTMGSEEGSIPSTIAGQNTYIRARLDLDVSSNKGQGLSTNQLVYVGSSTTAIGSGKTIKSQYPIQIIGGSDRLVETYSFDDSEYIKNSIYSYDSTQGADNDILKLADTYDYYYKLSVITGNCRQEESVTAEVPHNTNEDTLVMVYINPADVNAIDDDGTIKSLRCSSGIYNLNTNATTGGTSGNIDGKLMAGINVLRFTSASTFTINFNDGAATSPSTFTGSIVISKPRILNGTYTDAINPKLGVSSDEYANLLSTISGSSNEYGKYFYYTLYVDNANYIDDNLMDASTLFNVNNVCNKITIPEIQIRYAIDNITIAKSSQL